MKSTPLQRRTPLKSYSHLTTRVGLKQVRFIQSIPDTPKARLDCIVSEVVRRSAADDSGIATCVTCGGRAHWRRMQCGHFQLRGNLATRYNFKNLGVQCKGCNCDNEGESDKFAAHIDTTYGSGTAESLRVEAGKTIHDFPFQEEIEKWSALLAVLVEKQDKEIQY